jgi:serine phosphatase RsbU (regulator of sigma subunit)/streptogramin lyase
MKFSYTSSGNGLIKNYLESDGSLDRQVVCLFETKDGNIWMGSYGSGVFILDPQSEKITNLGKTSGLPNTNVMSIEQDNSGKIWLATLGGSAVILNPTANGYEIKQLSDFTHLKSEYIYTLYHDSQDQMWMGTDGAGVATFDCTNEYFKPGFGGILSDATIYSITEDNEGGMWFATADKGLFRYFKGSLKEYGAATGLRSNAVIALNTGEKGQLIAIHSLGIDVLSAGESVFMNYNIEKPGFSFEPNMNAICVEGSDFWIGTEDGAVKCVLADEREKTITPKVLITELRVLYEPRALNQGAEFGYGENHFVFDFQAIWLKNPGSVRYKFMLEGFDKDWSFETESRIATYSSLPPGEYTFKVVATNGNGQWSDEQESSYSFVILRPFWMQWWFYVLVFVVSATVVVYYIRWRTQKLIEDKKFLEAEVARRTEEISHQKDIIEEKNHEILDSINYAKRIQTAILPPDRLFKRHLPNAFVLYKPKDIVAGDFYWMQALDDIEDENHQSPVLFAAADCTGHGVPGAMVSVVCNNALNRAIREFGFTEPAQILNIVRTLVIEEFEKSEEEVKDGMDIALCAWDPKERVLQYAGAQNPLWIVTKRDLSLPSAKEPTLMADWKLFEIKPDKQPIGKYAETHPFTNHHVHLAKGDSIYIFSDGYADQFGGDKGKKFKCSSMKELILSIQDKPMDTQKTIINAHFESWRGELEQVDDVCVIGLRV